MLQLPIGAYIYIVAQNSGCKQMRVILSSPMLYKSEMPQYFNNTHRKVSTYCAIVQHRKIPGSAAVTIFFGHLVIPREINEYTECRCAIVIF